MEKTHFFPSVKKQHMSVDQFKLEFYSIIVLIYVFAYSLW